MENFFKGYYPEVLATFKKEIGFVNMRYSLKSAYDMHVFSEFLNGENTNVPIYEDGKETDKYCKHVVLFEWLIKRYKPFVNDGYKIIDFKYGITSNVEDGTAIAFFDFIIDFKKEMLEIPEDAKSMLIDSFDSRLDGVQSIFMNKI